MIVIVAGIASASTIIGGTVINGFSEPIDGASVTVSCDGFNLTTTSLSDGTYSVEYSSDDCPPESDIMAYAFKNGVGKGYTEGTIQSNYPYESWTIELALPPPGEFTIITGNITNADFTRPIEGATVGTDCGGATLETTSLSDGTYSVEYPGDLCSNMYKLTVYAEKDGLKGSASGIVQDNAEFNLNLAQVDVPLVPEFGVVVGMITIMGALGMFFYVRKK
jgi:hypothetical protein